MAKKNLGPRRQSKARMTNRGWEIQHEYKDRIVYGKGNRYTHGYLRARVIVYNDGSYSVTSFEYATRQGLLSYIKDNVSTKQLKRLFSNGGESRV